ncbi:YuzF family protein [Priestia aryabhattai]|uniref:YuzF family protein n=1 Tax=Priestia megaterium TaxID=1404 RepID=UPI0039B991F7
MNDVKWTLSDPYVYQNLVKLVRAKVAVQTAHGSVRGTLLNVEPDHIVVEMGGNSFFIRTQQIIWMVSNPSSPAS